MPTRIAINGFGRIGRLFYRALYENNFFNGEVEVVAVNDIVPNKDLAYLLKYDTLQGNMTVNVEAIGEDKIKVGEYEFLALSERKHPKELPWADHNIDIVVESTGLFRKSADAKGHIDAGAKKVVISAPGDDEARTIVLGANEDQLSAEDTIISNASCTTNCVVPLVQVLIQSGIGVEQGLLTTIHSYTADQALVDGAHPKDMRRGRAAALNMIPTSSGAAVAVAQVYPELKGKMDGMAVRVPTGTGSLVDLSVTTTNETSLAEINEEMKKAADSYLKGILVYTDEPVVSSDFVHKPQSSTYDSTASMQLNGNFFKLIAWYDNEWGYSNRLAELVSKVPV